MLNVTIKMQLSSARDKKEKTVVSKVTNELYSGKNGLRTCKWKVRAWKKMARVKYKHFNVNNDKKS